MLVTLPARPDNETFEVHTSVSTDTNLALEVKFGIPRMLEGQARPAQLGTADSKWDERTRVLCEGPLAIVPKPARPYMR
jgi:hypothetical protein